MASGPQARQQSAYGVSLYCRWARCRRCLSATTPAPVREALARLPGVGEVQMFGARDYSMRIWLRPDRMNALNITTDDVARSCASRMCRARRGRWAPAGI